MQKDNLPELANSIGKMGYVYLVLNHSRTAGKIGFTTNPYARFAQLQTASPDPLLVEFKIPACQGVERMLHSHFAEQRIRLEWFSGVDALEEFFCELETEYADNQLAEMLLGGPNPALLPVDVEAVIERIN